MKRIYLSTLFLALVSICYSQPKMQATIKPGVTARTIDIYLKSSASFSQRDEAMTFALAIPAAVTNGPTLGSAGVSGNTLGPVTGISGLQPAFLVNNLGTSQREAYVSMHTINGSSYYIYTFIFAGTAPTLHTWEAGVEQQIFSIQFNGCTSNCAPEGQQLVSLANGGNFGISYWYFQPNTLGDITNYEVPFYENPNSAIAENGLSNDGSALSSVSLANPVSFSKDIKKINNRPQGTGADVLTSTNELNSSVINATAKSDYQVYPNPVSNGYANLQIVNQPAGLYTVKVSNALGQVVMTKQLSHNGGTSNNKIELTNMAKGYYILDVAGLSTSKKSIKIVYQ